MQHNATTTAHSTGQTAQAPLNPNTRITARTVRQICGGVSDMTLHRWLKDPEKEFPRPLYIGKRRYWREAEIIAWLDAQAADTAA